jgi:glycosyltransferase involved in cell wall biosynthesis
LTSSVLIPSLGRPEKLIQCLSSISTQTVAPKETIVVWQGDDYRTRDAAEEMQRVIPGRFLLLHSPDVGIVAAENVALAAATGDVVLLIDDDAIAPEDWMAKHLRHYSDSSVGAVGGTAHNFEPSGAPFPKRSVEPIGKLAWYGRAIGNTYDHIAPWESRPPREVDHLAGNNMSVRRGAFERFEDGLRPYWQMFEADVCLQAKARGYRVLFDFGIVVRHYPTKTVYTPGREGDLVKKVYNGAYNHAFVLSKHSPRPLRACQLAYLLAVGSVSAPGLVAFAFAVARFGAVRRELSILTNVWRACLAGWKAGSKIRLAGR